MSSIKHEMTKGLFWTAIDKYSGFIIGLFISMVLARLLSPYEYGVVATASVLLVFLSIFTSIGIGPAIIQRNDLSQQDLDNIFTFTIFIGIFVGGLSFCSAWPIARFYDNEQLTYVIQILSVGLFLGALNMVPFALMSKHKRFKEMAIRSLAFQVLFGIIGIIAAYRGAGVYALIVPPIFASIFTFFYNNHFYPVHISIHFSLSPIKRIFSYSSYVFLFNLINYFSRNLDKLIIGKFFSAEALGYYEKSYRLMTMPLNQITSVINPVIQPVMSKLQNDMDNMARKYNKMIFYIASLSFPIAVILFYTASDIIRVMYGDKWDAAIPAFKILAFSIPTQLILSTSGAIWLSCNASKHLFWVGLTNTTVVVCGFLVGGFYFRTVEAIAWGWSITSVINFLFTYFVMYNQVLRSPLYKMLKQLFLPGINALLLIAAYYLYMQFRISDIPFVGLIVKSMIAIVVTIPFMIWIEKINVLMFIKKRTF